MSKVLALDGREWSASLSGCVVLSCPGDRVSFGGILNVVMLST
jgi:hypothetical protein